MTVNITLKLDDKQEKCFLIMDDQIINATKDDILDKLKAKRIVAGIKLDVIEEIISGQHKLSEKVVIAQNIPPQKGKDGDLRYIPLDDDKKEIDEKAKVDFYDVGIIKNVPKDTKLVEIIPPTEGVPGKTMFGEDIPGTLGRPASYNKVCGQGTAVTPDLKYVFASRDGVYQKNPIGVITIVDELELKSHLDFAIGNVDTSSAVIIHGDIKAGFQCKSGSSINVDGVIEDATVVAGDSIICKLGILPGIEPVKAKESIRARYIRDRETVECKNLSIEEMISGSNIKCLGDLEAKKIVGGSIAVKNKITVEEIGNEQFTQTKIEAGVNYKIIGRMNENRKELTEKKKLITDKKNDVNNTEIELKKHNRKIQTLLENNPGNKNILEKLNQENKELKNRINILNSEISQLTMDLDRLAREYEKLNKKIDAEDPEIIVNDKIYPNTHIKMKMGKIFEVSEIMSKVKFKTDEQGNIKILKL